MKPPRPSLLSRLAAASQRADATLRPLTAQLEAGMEASRPLWWSRAIIYAMIAFIVGVILWACVARIDQVVPATGRLRPVGTTREIQSPVAGVIESVAVRPGQAVKRGELLLRLDKKVTESRIASAEEICASLERENAFYQDVMSGKIDATAAGGLQLAEDVKALVRDRQALEGENRLFAAQAAFSDEGIALDPGQKKLFEEGERDRRARVEAATQQARQAQEALRGARAQLEKGERLLANASEIVASYSRLAKSGAVSRVDLLARESEQIEAQRAVEAARADVAKYAIEVAKTREEITNLDTRVRREAYDGIEQNRQRIAETDARLSKIVYENLKRLSEARGELTQLRQSLGYHDVTAPVDGVVFDLKHEQGSAVVTEKDVLMKIVPREDLIAEVFVTDEDIGFVHPGMIVRVRIDSFPAREFGDIPGELYFVGSDSLPPTAALPRYTFPCRIRLERQFINVHGRPTALQAGMAVSTYIHVRQRTVMSIFLDFLTKPGDRLREVR